MAVFSHYTKVTVKQADPSNGKGSNKYTWSFYRWTCYSEDLLINCNVKENILIQIYCYVKENILKQRDRNNVDIILYM